MPSSWAAEPSGSSRDHGSKAASDRRRRRPVATGDIVIFGFRIQAFVTRAFVVPVSGVELAAPRAEGVWTTDGSEAIWLS